MRLTGTGTDAIFGHPDFLSLLFCLRSGQELLAFRRRPERRPSAAVNFSER